MNKSTLIVIIAAVVIAGIFLIVNYQTVPAPEGEQTTSPAPEEAEGTTDEQSNTPQQPSTPSPAPTPAAKPISGKTSLVVFAIKDNAAGLTDLQSIFVTFGEVSIQVPGKGWIPVVSKQTSFDLLKLRREGINQFWGEINLPKGTYNQIRLKVDSVVVTKNNVPTIAKLPSGEMKINTNLLVSELGKSAVIFDFEADKSLHVAGGGEYIFAPVIKLTAQSMVTIQKFPTKVDFIGGASDFAGEVGMDENGDTRPNAHIDLTARLELAKGKIVVIPNDIDRSKLKISAESAADAATNAKYINNLLSVKAELRDGKVMWRVLGLLGTKLVKVYVNAETGEISAIE